MSIRIAVLTHCQMNENPFSNQEIHVLFQHGLKHENTSNEPWDLHDVKKKALRTRFIISPMFLFLKMLHTAMTF